jgi:hypothetical protein
MKYQEFVMKGLNTTSRKANNRTKKSWRGNLGKNALSQTKLLRCGGTRRQIKSRTFSSPPLLAPSRTAFPSLEQWLQ